jgi:hypothetical protein
MDFLINGGKSYILAIIVLSTSFAFDLFEENQ